LTEDGDGGDAKKEPQHFSDSRKDHDLEELGWRCTMSHG
jgi:hypothetical protein